MKPNQTCTDAESSKTAVVQQALVSAAGVEVGKVYRTPFEPAGLFRVLAIEPPGGGYDECAFGEFVGDHPRGYKDGTAGRYFSKELAGREVPSR